MSEKVFNMIFKIVTGVEMIAEGICGVCITNEAVKAGVLAGIPLVANCAIAVCKNFVKK